MAINLKKYKQEISASPRKTSAPVKGRASAGKQLKNDPTASQMKGTGDGFNFLSSLLQATLFFNYFEHVASKTYVGERLDLKVVKLKTLQPRFYSWSIKLDVVVRILAFIALFSAACFLVGATIYKVILK